MVSFISLRRACVIGSVAVALLTAILPAYAEDKSAVLELTSSKRPHELAYVLNPVTLLRHAFASLIGTVDSQSSSQTSAFAFARPLSIDFASRAESDRVSLILAESKVRVRLRRDLQLHCEVSSTDEADREPELGVDLALQFKF